MLLSKYKNRTDSILLVNADPEKVRVYMNSTRGILVDEISGGKLDQASIDMLDKNDVPTMKFKVANLEMWSKELPLTDVGSDTNYEFPWQEGRQAPVGVLATLLAKSDCEIRNITPIAVSPEMLVEPESEYKAKNLANVLSMPVDELKSRFAKKKFTARNVGRKDANPKIPLDIVIQGIDLKIDQLQKRTDVMLSNSTEARDSRQFMNGGGGSTAGLAMAAAELAFLDQVKSHASFINVSVLEGHQSKSSGLAQLSSSVTALESEYRKKALQVGNDIDITAIEYYGKHVRSELIPAARQMDNRASVDRSQSLVLPL